MADIIPAIMLQSFGDLRETVERFVGLVKVVQIDVMDGIFVPSSDWPYIEKDEDQLLPFSRGEEELPFIHEVAYEIDLMVANPKREGIRWLSAGAERLVFHIESIDISDAEELAVAFRSAAMHDIRGDDARHAVSVEIGIALNTDTPNKNIEHVLPYVDFVQCMGITKIGYQGQPFDDRVIEKIVDLREHHPDVIISVDGGVNLDTAPRLIRAGATRLVAGSAVLKQK